MKVLSMLVAALAVSLFSYTAYAKGSESTGNQNQVQTQNQGEESQLQVATQEVEGEDGGVPKSEASRSANARENMSVVSQAVEDLLTARTVKGGIGEEVRLIAQAQKDSQSEVAAELGKVESRKGLLKSLIGPDYQALKKMEKVMEQNQLRIRQLEQLKNQITNQGDETLVQEAIEALTEQNTVLADRIALEESEGGLLGWLVKLLVK